MSHQAVDLHNPIMAVLITPFGVRMEGSVWDSWITVDSAQYGDILGSVWQVGVRGKGELKFFQ